MQFLLIEGEFVQLETIAHIYTKKEVHKDRPYFVYFHFVNGARTYFRYNRQDEAEALMIFILNRMNIKELPTFSKGGLGRGEAPAPFTDNENLKKVEEYMDKSS